MVCSLYHLASLDQSSFNTASVCQIPAIESQNLADEAQMTMKEHAVGFFFYPNSHGCRSSSHFLSTLFLAGRNTFFAKLEIRPHGPDMWSKTSWKLHERWREAHQNQHRYMIQLHISVRMIKVHKSERNWGVKQYARVRLHYWHQTDIYSHTRQALLASDRHLFVQTNNRAPFSLMMII